MKPAQPREGEEMMAPTIHTGGTNREVLEKQLEECAHAVGEALRKLRECGPNGRDYYPQGREAINKAIAEHLSRVVRLKSVHSEIMDIYERIIL